MPEQPTPSELAFARLLAADHEQRVDRAFEGLVEDFAATIDAPPEAAVPSPSVAEARDAFFPPPLCIEHGLGTTGRSGCLYCNAISWKARAETAEAALASALTRAEQAEARVQGLRTVLSEIIVETNVALPRRDTAASVTPAEAANRLARAALAAPGTPEALP